MSAVQETASHLLDTLLSGRVITIDVTAVDLERRVVESLIMTIDDEARRRGVAVDIESKEGNTLCLSLHRP